MDNNQDVLKDDSLKNVKKSKEEAFEDDLIRAFDDVLDNDEKIVKGFKPCKAKLFFSNIFGGLMPTFILILFSVFVMLMPEDSSPDKVELLVAIIVPASIFLVVLFFDVLFTSLYYKNTFFAYTNKRVLIRSGIFGVDYKSLDIDKIGASNVYVSLLDKILRKNTGTIRFGSASSPMANNSNLYCFNHIYEPYKVYKEIKQYIVEKQKNN